MGTKLDRLKASLVKKQQAFDDKLAEHMDSVAQANGQPLNDKRGGAATISRWDKQSDALRALEEGIAKTKAAMEDEKGTLALIAGTNATLPVEILELVESGELTQWRKYPHIFFVDGVDKARIIWDRKNKRVAHKYVNSITDQAQRTKFVRIYNQLYVELNAQ